VGERKHICVEINNVIPKFALYNGQSGIGTCSFHSIA
jgi:hypothetical protein